MRSEEVEERKDGVVWLCGSYDSIMSFFGIRSD